MGGEAGTLLDPLLQKGDLRRGETVFPLGWHHVFIVVRQTDRDEETALLRLARFHLLLHVLEPIHGKIALGLVPLG